MGVFDIYGDGMTSDCNIWNTDVSSVLAAEAFRYAITRINSDVDNFHGIKLSGAVISSCRRLQNMENISNSNRLKTLAAVVDASRYQTALRFTKDELSGRMIPVITSNQPADTNDPYPYWLKMVGQDQPQARALVDVIKALQWNYVTVLYSDGPPEVANFRKFITLAEEAGICIATQVKLDTYTLRSREAMQKLVRFYLVNGFPESKVILTIMRKTDFKIMLEAVRKVIGTESNGLTWLNALPFGTALNDLHGLPPGSIFVQFSSNAPSGFRIHAEPRNLSLNGITSSSNWNPWIVEFWQNHFRCYIQPAFRTVYRKPCNQTGDHIDVDTSGAASISYVIDSVYSVAEALKGINPRACLNGSSANCTSRGITTNGLFDSLMGLNFRNKETSRDIQFDVFGNARSHFDIFNLEKSAQRHRYVKVRV